MFKNPKSRLALRLFAAACVLGVALMAASPKRVEAAWTNTTWVVQTWHPSYGTFLNWAFIFDPSPGRWAFVEEASIRRTKITSWDGQNMWMRVRSYCRDLSTGAVTASYIAGDRQASTYWVSDCFDPKETYYGWGQIDN